MRRAVAPQLARLPGFGVEFVPRPSFCVQLTFWLQIQMVVQLI